MKNLLISYTAIVAFIVISLVSALFITDNTEPFVALQTNEVTTVTPSPTKVPSRVIYFCRMTRTNLNEEPLKVCNELVGGYLGFDKWKPGYQLKIAKSVNLQNPVGTNPVDTTCSVVQWDVYDQVFVKYSADANNYCHYEADNNHCSFDGVRRPFDKTGLAMLKQQFDQKCVPATATPKPTNTPTPTATATPTPTNTPTPTATATPTPTNTPTPTATATPKPTNTPTPTVTATPEPTNTPTPTTTATPKPTNTPTPTVTFTPTPTVTFTPTPTITVTITPSVTPTATPTVTPTVTATPVITPTPTPQVEGDKTVFGFNFSKAVAGKLHYMVGEKIVFKVDFHNTGTEEVTKIYMRDVFTTDMRAEKVFLVSGNIRQDVTDLFINDQTRENGLIMPRDPYNPSQLLNLASIAGSLEQDEKLTLEFTFKAISKNDLVCNQAFTSINGRREVQSSKVCVGINAIIPITD